MKWNTALLITGLLGLGVVGATQGLAPKSPTESTTYWANGKLQSRVETNDGTPSGWSERWYPSGAKQAQGSFRAGRMDGPWEFWLPDGTPDVERTGTYRAGVRILESETTGGGL